MSGAIETPQVLLAHHLKMDTSGNWQREAFGDSICVTVARG